MSNIIKPGKIKKQPFEEWVIAGDFTENMDIAGGEDLAFADCTIEAIDVQKNDATQNGSLNAAAQIVNTSTKAIGTGDEQGYLKCLLKGGVVNETIDDIVEDRSPYKITFKAKTTTDEKWEKDVIVTIRDL